MKTEASSLLSFLMAFIFFTMLFRTSESVCCPSKTIAFRLNDENDVCSSYEAKSKGKGVCKVDVCNDGTFVKGRYCGRGSCNIFGCNCSGGCRKGDAAKNFVDFYGDLHISDVHFI
ncbi:protein Diedel-like [Drosophila nasuta]|uniref:protein Diedel-like n=1 Tax=Drosophila nasuta TaxID=42062 RepID=UPI00295F0ADC|nr:protein Diedel-like [Drosophila nasuta]